MGLAACAGNPPAWWNPGNIYSSQGESTSATPTAPARATTPSQTTTEQTLNLPNEDYEEMALTPLQDEEGENDSGESSAQSIPELEDLLPPPSILD